VIRAAAIAVVISAACMIIWNLRARLLTAGDPLRAAFDQRLLHTDYPLLVPLLSARLGSPALVALGFAVLLPLALWRFARDLASPDAAALTAALLLATPLFAGTAAAQYADVPLAAFVHSSSAASRSCSCGRGSSCASRWEHCRRSRWWPRSSSRPGRKPTTW
jgi:hypothetical protein